jgi:hypothetical protein
MAARPRSIVWFEYAYLLALVLSILTAYLNWDQTIAQVDATPGYEGRGLALAIWSVAFWIPVNLLLWYLAAHRRSAAGKWMIAGLAVVNAFDFMTLSLTGNIRSDIPGLLGVAVYFASFVALWFLFRPDSNRWFDADGGYPDIFS